MVMVRLKQGLTYRGLLYPCDTKLEVPGPTAERMEKKGLAEVMYSGLILPESALPEPKKGKGRRKRKPS